MCVVSMVMEHQWEEWNRKYNPPTVAPSPIYVPIPMGPTKEEIEEFRRLLERARKYDKDHNEPDCELEEKRKALKELARKMGVGELEFV